MSGNASSGAESAPWSGATMDFKGLVEKAKGAAAAATDMAREVATAAAEQAKGAVAATAEPAPEGAAKADGEAPPAPDTAALVAAACGDVAESAAPGQAKTAPILTSQKLAELKELGAAKVQELVTSFQQALPAIKTAGYELTEFEIELGVTPKLIPHFRHAAKTSEDVASAREALRDNKLGALILNGLLKAGEMHKQIKVAGYCFSHVEIELGLIPSIRLQYKNDDAAPEAPAC
jgi:hypothetical protein